MTLSEAIKKAEEWRKNEWCEGTVCFARDCGDRWFFGFEEDRNTFSGLFLFVFKTDGRIECLSYAEFVNLMFDGEITCTPIDLPKEQS